VYVCTSREVLPGGKHGLRIATTQQERAVENDECEEAIEVTQMLVLIAIQFPQVRMLLFSRHENEIGLQLHDFEYVSIAAVSLDLRSCVAAQIERRAELGKLRIRDSDVEGEIMETPVNGADGI
jgi:hypothetical protein